MDEIQLPWPEDREVWRPVMGFPNYDVSSLGNMRSWAVRCWGGRSPRSKPISLLRTGCGHIACVLYDNKDRYRFWVHRVVLLAFFNYAPESDEQVRHLNGDPGDNSVNNLAWGTAIENAHDKWRHGTYMVGAKNGNAKLNDDSVRDIRARWLKGEHKRAIAAYHKVSPSAVHQVVTGQKWTHVPWPENPIKPHPVAQDRVWQSLSPGSAPEPYFTTGATQSVR